MTIKQALREVVLSKMTLEDKIATILNVVTEGITGEMIEDISYKFSAGPIGEGAERFANAIKEKLGGE